MPCGSREFLSNLAKSGWKKGSLDSVHLGCKLQEACVQFKALEKHLHNNFL